MYEKKIVCLQHSGKKNVCSVQLKYFDFVKINSMFPCPKINVFVQIEIKSPERSPEAANWLPFFQIFLSMEGGPFIAHSDMKVHQKLPIGFLFFKSFLTMEGGYPLPNQPPMLQVMFALVSFGI